MGRVTVAVPSSIIVTNRTSLLEIFPPAKLYRFVKEYIAHKWEKADIIRLTQVSIAFYNLRYIEGMINSLHFSTFPAPNQCLAYKINADKPWGYHITRFRGIYTPSLRELSIRASANPSEPETIAEKISLLETLSTLSLSFPANLDSDTVKKYLLKIFTETQLSALTTLKIESSTLKEIPISIEKLTQLQTLNLSGCISLTLLPNEIGNLTALHTINFSQCQALPELPIQIAQFRGLKTLMLRNTQIAELPAWINTLNALEILDLDGCLKLTAIPPELTQRATTTLKIIYPLHLEPELTTSQISRPIDTTSLSSSAPPTPTQSKIKIYGTGLNTSIEFIFESTIEALPQELGKIPEEMTALTLEGNITALPQGLGQLTKLNKLTIIGNIEDLPQGLGNLPKLEWLKIRGNVTHLPQGLGQLTKLNKLTIIGNIEDLPQGLGNLPKLERLKIRGNVTHLPQGLGQLPKLRSFTISENIKNLPQVLGNLLELERLMIKVTRLPQGLGQLPLPQHNIQDTVTDLT